MTSYTRNFSTCWCTGLNVSLDLMFIFLDENNFLCIYTIFAGDHISAYSPEQLK